jgi:hypothetical protein
MTMPVDDEGDLRRIAALVLGTLALFASTNLSVR